MKFTKQDEGKVLWISEEGGFGFEQKSPTDDYVGLVNSVDPETGTVIVKGKTPGGDTITYVLTLDGKVVSTSTNKQKLEEPDWKEGTDSGFARGK